MNSQPHPGFSTETMNVLRHVCASTLAVLQSRHQSGSAQQTDIIPAVPSYPPATPFYYPLERDMYLDPVFHLLNRNLHVQFPSQSVPNVAPPSTFPNDHTAPPSSNNLPSTLDDDNIIVEAISRGDRGGKNLSEAMAELSGVNGRSTVDWVNYYIQNSHRIREKMPSKPLRGGEATPSTLARSARSFTSADGKRENNKIASEESRPSQQRGIRAKRKRRYSLPNSSDLSWPKPPRAVKMGSRCRYTVEDDKYMKRFFEIAFKHYPDANFAWIQGKLAAQAPHHSLKSWSGYCYKHNDVLKRIQYKAAREHSSDSIGEDSNGQDTELMQSSTSETTFESEEATPVLSGVQAPDGIKGTDPGEMQSIANFIATNKDWLSRPQTRMVKWRQFSLQHKPKRSPKAWSKFYMNNRDVIDQRVRDIKRTNKERKEMESSEEESCLSLDESLRSSSPSSTARKVRSNSPEL